MPVITYRPGGSGEGEVFDFSFDDIPYPEAVVIQKMTGLNFYTQVRPAFLSGDVVAIGAVLYVMIRRNEPEIQPESILDSLHPTRDLTVDYNVAEARALLLTLTALPPSEVTPELRVVMDDLRTKVGVDEPDEEPATEGEDPKA